MAKSTVGVYSKVKQQVVSVGATATKLPLTPLDNRRFIIVQNLSTNPIYLGSSTVTTTGATRGVVLANQYDSISVDITEGIDLYGIAGSASDAAILELV